MVVRAADIISVLAVEAKLDPVLIVDANGLGSSAISFERMQSIARWYAEIVELRHRVDLVELASNDRPQGFGNSAGRPAVHTMPNVPCRIIAEGPGHSAAG